MSLSNLIQKDIAGWQAVGDIETYDRETIFKYMNGAGEIYRMYNYRDMEVLHLGREGQPEVKVEMFDMGTPEDAFGVFSHMREGEEAGVGEGSEYRKGLLCFWQNKYFFCIIAEEETPETKDFIFLIASEITGSIDPVDKKPEILNLLPEDNLDINSVRYFRLPSSLNYHYFVAEGNILNLNDSTEAVLGRYQPKQSYLLVIKYHCNKMAAEALDSFMTAYLPDTDKVGIYEIEKSKWLGIDLYDEFITIVFDAPSERNAAELVQSVKENIQNNFGRGKE